MKQALAYVALGVGFYLVACGESRSTTGTSCEAGAGGADDAVSISGKGGTPEPAGGTSNGGSAGSQNTTPGGEGGQPPQLTGGAAGAEPEAGAGGISDVGEAGGGGEGGAPEPPSLKPDELDGLALWLEASTDACIRDAQDQVSSCSDLSGNANHATQADTLRQPTFLAATASAPTTLRFDDEPSFLTIPDAVTLRFGEGDFAFLIVGRWHNEPQRDAAYNGAGAILTKQNQFFPYQGVAIFANYESIYQVTSMTRFTTQLALGGPIAFSHTGHLNDDVFRLYVARRIGDSLELRINGKFEGSVGLDAGTAIDGQGVPMTIGGQGGYQFRGELSEIVVVKGNLASPDLEAAERGLLVKYGL